MSYYSDLSADSSDDGASTSSEESQNRKSNNTRSNGKSDGGLEKPKHHREQQSRVILHLDLDCFYCACEEIERKLEKTRPLAIGQKHIIVTCNYEARKYGVKKLQLKEDAYRTCPNLLIVDGSDLERYRRHARNIYEVFRECLQGAAWLEVFFENSASTLPPNHKPIPPVTRGRGMDEMEADITGIVDFLYSSNGVNAKIPERSNVFIYGEDKLTSTTLTEDQTGQQSTIGPFDAAINSNQSPFPYGNVTKQRLLIGAQVARFAQKFISEKTKFTITIGISVNPLLSKVASDLHKPMSINVLYPWRVPQRALANNLHMLGV